VIFLLLITAIGLRVLFDAPRLIFLLVAMVALIRTLNFSASIRFISNDGLGK